MMSFLFQYSENPDGYPLRGGGKHILVPFIDYCESTSQCNISSECAHSKSLWSLTGDGLPGIVIDHFTLLLLSFLERIGLSVY